MHCQKQIIEKKICLNFISKKSVSLRNCMVNKFV
jgi:hypothetical protein